MFFPTDERDFRSCCVVPFWEQAVRVEPVRELAAVANAKENSPTAAGSIVREGERREPS